MVKISEDNIFDDHLVSNTRWIIVPAGTAYQALTFEEDNQKPRLAVCIVYVVDMENI